MAKIPFLDKLTGALPQDDYDDMFDNDDADMHGERRAESDEHEARELTDEQQDESSQADVELAVDVYQTPEEIVVRALVAGVTPANLDVSLTRDMVVIKGSREEHKEVEDDSYFYSELYWGSFARTILLPEEVEVDEATATENHGVLVIRLPKINKARKAKIKVRSK